MSDIGNGKPPKRRNHIFLDVHADTLEELRRALAQIADELVDTGNDTVTGGSSWAGYWVHKVDPEQTHERFVQQLEAWQRSAGARIVDHDKVKP